MMREKNLNYRLIDNKRLSIRGGKAYFFEYLWPDIFALPILVEPGDVETQTDLT